MKIRKGLPSLPIGALAVFLGLSGFAFADETSVELVRRNLPILYQEVKQLTGRQVPAVNVIEEEDGSIHLESFFGMPEHRTYVILRDVNTSNIEEKLREAASVIVVDIHENEEMAEELVRTKDLAFVSATSSPHQIIQVGGGTEVGVGINGRPYLSVWSQLPAIFSSTTPDSWQNNWIRTSLVIQGTLTPDSGGSPILVTRLNASLFESRLEGTGVSKDGRPEGVALVFRIADFNPSVQFDTSNGTSTGRLDIGIASFLHTTALPIVHPDVLFIFSQGARAAIRKIDENKDHVGLITAQMNYQIGLILKETAFVLTSGELDAVDGKRAIYNFEVATGYHLSNSSHLKLGVRYRHGSDPFILVPEGWSFLSSYQMLF